MVLDTEVIHRRLQLGVIDSTTGWYPKYWAESVIDMLIIPRSARNLASVAGSYVRLDALGLTCDEVRFGDEIEQEGSYYEVKGIRDHRLANSFSHRECDLTLLPLHALSYSPLDPTVNDARYNVKVYLETNINDVNLQNYNWIACYSNADYPFTRVFDTKGIVIIFSIDSPDSTPLMKGDLTPYGYEEHTSIHILTLNTEVNHLAEAELRRVCETVPTGTLNAQRGLERRGTMVHNFGSTRVFDTEFLVNYRRGTT